MSARPAAFSTWRAATLVALAATCCALGSVVAQESTKIMGINGSWERYPSLAAGLGSDTEHEPPPPPAPISDPPLKPEYLAEWRAARARERELTQQGIPPVNSGSACLPQGMPGMMMGMFPMEVLETPGQVTFIQEAFNQVRRVYLDEELIAAEDAEPRFSGHSVGHWEGDTLVMETVGVKENARFQGAPHSMNMRISERLRLLGENYMENVVTVTDPEYLTEPWTWTFMYRRWPGYKIQEYVCEDNRYYEDPELGYQRLRIPERERE
jgi:hypothetical protein